MSTPPLFFHVDLDAFFASVEQLDNPDYRGKPVIIGGKPEERSVVSTCSYEARAFGVHSAMPMIQAVKLCPHAIFVRGNMKRYQEKSREVMNILSRFSPDVHQMSIDEAFLDMTGTERLFGLAEKSAQQLKDTVKSETGLTISVGAASNRYVAKIASDYNKPDGLCIVPPGTEESFMMSMPISKIRGIGKKTRKRLEDLHLDTPAALYQFPQPLLENMFGSSLGSFLYASIRGIDPGFYTLESKSRSMSTERTFYEDISNKTDLETVLLEMSHELMFRMLDTSVQSKTVHIKIRYSDFTTVSMQKTFSTPFFVADELFEQSCTLFEAKWKKNEPVRLLGLCVSNIFDTGSEPVQAELFESSNTKKRKVEEAILAHTKKHPGDVIKKARIQ